MKHTINAVVLAAALLVPASVLAQRPATRGSEVTQTFTITAINPGIRIVTLKSKEGLVDNVYCGPEVQRFNELKVGDTVTFRYYESLVTTISKPGDATRAATSTTMTRNAGAPGGTMSQQMSATVTIMAIHADVPSVVVKKDDGSQESFQVSDKKALEGYKAGDKIDVTYTQAVAISVTK